MCSPTFGIKGGAAGGGYSQVRPALNYMFTNNVNEKGSHHIERLNGTQHWC